MERSMEVRHRDAELRGYFRRRLPNLAVFCVTPLHVRSWRRFERFSLDAAFIDVERALATVTGIRVQTVVGCE